MSNKERPFYKGGIKFRAKIKGKFRDLFSNNVEAVNQSDIKPDNPDNQEGIPINKDAVIFETKIKADLGEIASNFDKKTEELKSIYDYDNTEEWMLNVFLPFEKKAEASDIARSDDRRTMEFPQGYLEFRGGKISPQNQGYNFDEGYSHSEQERNFIKSWQTKLNNLIPSDELNRKEISCFQGDILDLAKSFPDDFTLDKNKCTEIAKSFMKLLKRPHTKKILNVLDIDINENLINDEIDFINMKEILGQLQNSLIKKIKLINFMIKLDNVNQQYFATKLLVYLDFNLSEEFNEQNMDEVDEILIKRSGDMFFALGTNIDFLGNIQPDKFKYYLCFALLSMFDVLRNVNNGIYKLAENEAEKNS